MAERIDKITGRDRVQGRGASYSDIYTNFNRHPETGALVRLVDEASVKRSLRNLILTNRGERMFQPTLGTDLYKMLFDNMSPVTEDLIKTYITDAINDYEPRVSLITVRVIGNELTNSYDVAIVFEIINSTTPSTLNLTLRRVR